MNRERSLDTFGAFANEDLDSIRPEYDFVKYQEELAGLEKKIRVIKHAISMFNVNTVLPNMDGLTIDQALVYLPQLTAQKQKLGIMARRLPKERLQNSRTTTAAVSEFCFANYDIKTAKEEYKMTVDTITALQSALDLINNTETFEIDL
ncbi:MAG: hypothetical protein LUI14_12320 [Lachnospiraceae bacterium]|nr:hypothetical protein [Lachnospiraceae bacterium]